MLKGESEAEIMETLPVINTGPLAGVSDEVCGRATQLCRPDHAVRGKCAILWRQEVSRVETDGRAISCNLLFAIRGAYERTIKKLRVSQHRRQHLEGDRLLARYRHTVLPCRDKLLARTHEIVKKDYGAGFSLQEGFKGLLRFQYPIFRNSQDLASHSQESVTTVCRIWLLSANTCNNNRIYKSPPFELRAKERFTSSTEESTEVLERTQSN